MRNRIFGLDLMRAVAIGLVLASHARELFRGAWPDAWRTLIPLGVGVEVFFALSGFLIGGILIRDLESGERNPMRFWSRRWWRTVPAYWLFLLIYIGLTLALDGYRLPMRVLGRYAAFSQNLLWEIPTFFVPSWSLTVEEWFYLIFAALAFGLSSRWPPRRAVLVAALAVVIVGSGSRWVRLLALDPPWNRGIRQVVICRLDSIAYGVVGAWISAYRPALWRAVRWPGLALAAVLLVPMLAAHWAVCWGYLPTIDRSWFFRSVFYDLLGVGMLCLLPALSGWTASPPMAGRWVERVSLWSYAMYLSNESLFVLFVRYLAEPESMAWAIVHVVAWLALTIAVSALVYHGFESRMTRLRDLDIQPLIRRATGAVSVAARETVGSR